jgi:hypothetical protein
MKLMIAQFSFLSALMGAAFGLTLAPTHAHADASALWTCRGISINVSGPSAISVGGVLNYEVRIHNGSDCDLQGADVADFIPRMSSYQQASPQPTAYPGLSVPAGNAHPVPKIEWKNVEIGSGKDIYFRVSARVQSPDERTLLNTVCFEHNQTGRICSQVETTVTRD